MDAVGFLMDSYWILVVGQGFESDPKEDSNFPSKTGPHLDVVNASEARPASFES